MARFLETVKSQKFDYVHTPDNKLRQYWCPYCDEITIAADWHCESCGKWFSAEDIDGQVDKPPIQFDDETVQFLEAAFRKILEGVDPKEALLLKPGKKRTSPSEYKRYRFAATLVHRKIIEEPSKSINIACHDVLSEHPNLFNFSVRTLETWYSRFTFQVGEK